MLAAAALFFSALRPQIETLQPAATSACAMPRPIPPLPPVITAVRPERSKMLIGRFHIVWPAFVAGGCSAATMDNAVRKIKYGRKNLEIVQIRPATRGRGQQG